MCGYEFLEFNNSVFLAERTSVDRDIALAYFMRENKCFPPGADIKNIIEFYFQVEKSSLQKYQIVMKYFLDLCLGDEL